VEADQRLLHEHRVAPTSGLGVNGISVDSRWAADGSETVLADMGKRLAAAILGRLNTAADFSAD
jgi:hypothetical protein